MVLVASHGVVVYGCGSGELVSPGIYGGGSTGDDGRREMIFHVVAFGMLHAVVSYGSGLRIVVRIHRYCGQGGEMEQETTESHKVKGIAGAYSPFVEADGEVLGGGLRPVEACTDHPAAGAALLYVALAEGSREGELARVEGIIEVDIDGVLRYLSFGDVYAFHAVVLMSVQRLRREINHVEAIAVAVRVEIELKVLALAGKLGRIDSHTL